jgi:benzaldehyde dehydrogenase (NAD)
LLCGGKAEGAVMPATLRRHVCPQRRHDDEETFGPFVCIVRVATTEKAPASANADEYGPPAAVFGRDVARAFNVARNIDVRSCHPTCLTMHDEAQVCFGGIKGSGVGR